MPQTASWAGTLPSAINATAQCGVEITGLQYSLSCMYKFRYGCVCDNDYVNADEMKHRSS